MATCSPSPESPENLAKGRPTSGPIDRSLDHNPWSRTVGQTPSLQLPVANDGRQEQTIGPSTVQVINILITRRSVIDLQFSSISGESSFFEDD
uniref:Uncharacterized protein n=1 Tax=Solanum tuberosum TaxID=4113 RepID=M1DAN3_SOLTU